MALLRSYLFAPGNDERLLEKVFAAGADAVVLDLEDAVPPAEKDRARERVARSLAARPAGAGPRAFVRINGVASGRWEEDLQAVVCPTLAGLRVPKAESAEDLARVAAALVRAEERARLAAGSVELVATIETARGVASAAEIAAAPRMRNLTFGAADFASDVGAEPGEDETETLLARSRLVLASRLAGIDPPVASVFTRLADDEGLRRSTEAGRRLGFFGRSCIHPRQVRVVHEVFTPGPEAVARARRIVEAFEKGVAASSGAVTTEDGQFVDLAVARRARALLALARSLEPHEEVPRP